MKTEKKLANWHAKSFVLLFVCLLSSCARVNIKNAEWCGDLGPEGAECFKTLTDDTRSLNFEEWEKERFGMVCTQPENFGNWKAAILKLCRVPGNRCTYDVKKKVIEFSGKIDGFVDRVEKVKVQYPYLNEGEYHDPL